MELLEPGGSVRATLNDGASVEALVGAAWGVREGLDRLTVVSVTEGWELAIFRRGMVPCIKALGVVSRERLGNRKAMIETAWAELLDEGWTVRRD